MRSNTHSNLIRSAPQRVRLAMAILLCLAAACGGSDAPIQSSFDAPTYDSFLDAARSSDIVVVATVTADTMTVTDTGGETDPEALEAGGGLEQLLTDVEVTSYLMGSGDSRLRVVQPLHGDEQNTHLEAGDTVVLALMEQGPDNAPSVYSQAGITWAPRSLDYGIAVLSADGTVDPLVEGQAGLLLTDLQTL